MKKNTQNLLSNFLRWKLLNKLFIPFIFIFFTIATNGQSPNINVTGKVTDNITGESLIGVSISVKGTAKGVTSDLDGMYSISQISKGDILLFSYLGYDKLEVKIENEKILNVTLSAASNELGEVVIVAYGKKKKRNLTGSIASVSSEAIAESNAQDPISAIQGRAAGVQVVSNSGAPGGGMSIKGGIHL